MTKTVLAIILTSLFSYGSIMFGTTNPTPSNTSNKKEAVATKIAFFNTKQLFENSKEYLDAAAPIKKELKRVQDEFTKQENRIKAEAEELKKMSDELNTKQINLKNKKNLMSEEALQEAQDEIISLQQDIQAKNEQLVTRQQNLYGKYQQFDAYIAQKEAMIRQALLEKIHKIRTDLVAKDGWDVILPEDGPISKRVDVTMQIVDELNKNYKPAKPETVPTKQVSAKPAQKAVEAI